MEIFYQYMLHYYSEIIIFIKNTFISENYMLAHQILLDVGHNKII